MNKEDFTFLYRKEFLILFGFLTLIAISQIALDQQVRIGSIEPFLVLNISFLESLGLLLPIFANFYFFIYNRKFKETEWIPPRKWIVIFLIIYLAILFIPIPENIENIIITDTNTTTTLIPNTITQTTTLINPTSSINPTDPGGTQNQIPEISNLEDLRTILLIAILLMPLILIITIQRRTHELDLQGEKESVDLESEEINQFSTRSILECYYQASTALEERGAESSDSLTPTEFETDVKVKDLTQPFTIDNLTDIFEEAKFSSHEMTAKQVAEAKKLAGSILFPTGDPKDINLNSEAVFDKIQEEEE